jgi:hypothetical protein
MFPRMRECPGQTTATRSIATPSVDADGWIHRCVLDKKVGYAVNKQMNLRGAECIYEVLRLGLSGSEGGCMCAMACVIQEQDKTYL